MGIFTRLKDIIGSNLNAMLEKAEDPEKLIKLMIQEMEDTLVELKASCAGAMATRKRIDRDLAAAEAKVELWLGRAELALNRDRDDLAREALVEKARYQEKVAALESEASQADELVAQYRQDIGLLEEKLAAAREKRRMLVRRHDRARGKKRAHRSMRRLETSDAWVRFEQFENRIERMEADADLVGTHRSSEIEGQFADLDDRGEIEEELELLRQKVKGTAATADDAV